MPDMTAEQITALQAAAQERDPQPEPLDAPEPEREPVAMRATVTKIGGSKVVLEDFDLTAEYDERGNLVVVGGGLPCAIFNQWSSCVFEETSDEPDVAAASQPSRVLTDADVSAIAKALAPGFSGKLRPEGGRGR